MKRKRRPLPADAVELVATRFRVLGEPIRIRILEELQSGEKSVGEIVAAVGSTQPNVSKHLRILMEAGLVGRRQAGTIVFCSVADPVVFDLCDAVCRSIQARLAAGGKLAAEIRRGRQ